MYPSHLGGGCLWPAHQQRQGRQVTCLIDRRRGWRLGTRTLILASGKAVFVTFDPPNCFAWSREAQHRVETVAVYAILSFGVSSIMSHTQPALYFKHGNGIAWPVSCQVDSRAFPGWCVVRVEGFSSRKKNTTRIAFVGMEKEAVAEGSGRSSKFRVQGAPSNFMVSSPRLKVSKFRYRVALCAPFPTSLDWSRDPCLVGSCCALVMPDPRTGCALNLDDEPRDINKSTSHLLQSTTTTPAAPIPARHVVSRSNRGGP
jgi:hypothetical protein